MEVSFTPYRALAIEAITNAGGQGISTNQGMGASTSSSTARAAATRRPAS
jgi:hypothetical protein